MIDIDRNGGYIDEPTSSLHKITYYNMCPMHFLVAFLQLTIHLFLLKMTVSMATMCI